jgi:hypothetical protein
LTPRNSRISWNWPRASTVRILWLAAWDMTRRNFVQCIPFKKLTIAQLRLEFVAFREIWRFSVMFTGDGHWSLSRENVQQTKLNSGKNEIM